MQMTISNYAPKAISHMQTTKALLLSWRKRRKKQVTHSNTLFLKQGIISPVHSLKTNISSIKNPIRSCTTRQSQKKNGQIISSRCKVVHSSNRKKSIQTLRVSAIQTKKKNRPNLIKTLSPKATFRTLINTKLEHYIDE